MTPTKRKCLYCGKMFEGRSDKKYCSELHRIAYSNDQKIQENKEIRTVSLALRKNRNILKRFKGEKEYALVSEEALVLNGFLFDYHTHYFTSESQKNIFTFCFDYGYRDMGNKQFKIIRRW